MALHGWLQDDISKNVLVKLAHDLDMLPFQKEK